MSDNMSYNTGTMRTVAGDILKNANKAHDAHQTAWQNMEAHIQTYPGFIQGVLRSALEPYERRLRASYDWQIATAHALANAADVLEQTEQEIAQTFEG